MGKHDIVVAKDGSGDFERIQDAIDSIRVFWQKKVIIFVKNGIYKEKVKLHKYMENISLIGEDADKTILTYDDYACRIGYDGKKIGTYKTPTLTVDGKYFCARNITFENSSGYGENIIQAVAVDVTGDECVFENCRFIGWQDTLLAGRGRQYFKNCYIEGYIDFIFGSSTAVFENCRIFCKAPGYIAAASTNRNDEFGFVFLNCDIDGCAPKGSVYLGRPWRPYAHTAYINCRMGDCINASGWYNWNDTENEKTARFEEYESKGSGASGRRVSWSRKLNFKEASKYTLDNIFSINSSWNVKL